MTLIITLVTFIVSVLVLLYVILSAYQHNKLHSGDYSFTFDSNKFESIDQMYNYIVNITYLPFDYIMENYIIKIDHLNNDDVVINLIFRG